MKESLEKLSNRKSISSLPVVRNFRKVIEARDINFMNNELYQFLNLYCSFIAHYNINGFKATYSHPTDFAEVFIRHFDGDHKYYSASYPYQSEIYKETWSSKAEIKQEFCRIVDEHKYAIGKWAEKRQRDERYAAYLRLKKEFEIETNGIEIICDACGNEYEVTVRKEGEDVNDFGIICCLFCGRQIKLY
ncbi:MAG TPA: hypothetical protein VMW42_03395 [Desulfatiglandales bacterium]|nr:hypothetical protein [Desulfatiglandales bacterium]